MAEIVGAVAGPLIGGIFSGDGEDAQVGAANNATALQGKVFDTVNSQEAPYRSIGYGALNQLATLLGIQPSAANGDAPGLSSDPSSRQFGSLMKAFQPGDLTTDPSYGFRLAQGQKSINSNAGMRGGLYSGNTLKALQDFGQQSASQEYTNAFNRDASNKDRLVNYLTSAAGMGSNAAGRTQVAGQNYANNAGQNMMGAANVQAASGLARGNAWSDAANNVFSIGKRNNWWQTPGTANATGFYGGDMGDTSWM